MNLISKGFFGKWTPDPLKVARNQFEYSTKLSIILPVFNEGMNLRVMISMLNAAVIEPHEVIVVCDSDQDTSIPVVRDMSEAYTNIRLVLNNIGKGVINAVKSGVECSRGEYIVIFAADELGPVMALDEIIRLLDEGNEFVSCTRYSMGGRRLGGSIASQVLSRAANFLFHSLIGTNLSDATTGIKAFRRDVFERFELSGEPVGWAFAFEMAIKAQLLRLKMAEVPIISVDRLYGGESTFKIGSWVVEYLRWFLWGSYQFRVFSSRVDRRLSFEK